MRKEEYEGSAQKESDDFFSDSRRGGTGRLAKLHKIERGELPPCGPPELVALWHIKKANESLDEVYRAFQKLPIGTFIGLQTGGRDYLGSLIDRAGGVHLRNYQGEPFVSSPRPRQLEVTRTPEG